MSVRFRRRLFPWVAAGPLVAVLALTAAPALAEDNGFPENHPGYWVSEAVDATDDDFWGKIPDGRGLPRFVHPPDLPAPGEERCEGATMVRFGSDLLWICPPTPH